MKKLLIAALSLSLLGTAGIPALAASGEPPMVIASAPVTGETAGVPGCAIEVDGKPVDGRACIMVPLRPVAEQLGFTVSWDNDVITMTGSGRYAVLTVGRDEYFAAPTEEGMMGASLFSLGGAPYVVNGTSYVPVELFDVLLGCKEGTVSLEGTTIKISTDPDTASSVQIPNPFVDYSSLDDAAAAAGFALTVPESIPGYGERTVQVMDRSMIQAVYGGEQSSLLIRKAAGSNDISGDYNVYSQIEAVDIDGVSVTEKGENGLVMVAIWSSGGYTYAVVSDAGMGAEDLSALIRSVK